MGSYTLQTIQQGLSSLRNQSEARHKVLVEQLARKERISDEDEAWLDDAGNLCEEDAALDILLKADSFDDALKGLSNEHRQAVERMITAADGNKDGANHKRVLSASEANKISQAKRSRKKEPAPVFTKKENATLQQKVEILDWHHANGRNQTKTARHFSPIYPNLLLKQPLVSAWIKSEESIRESASKRSSFKRVAPVKHQNVDEALELWTAQAVEDGLNLTGEVLRQKWRHFARIAEIPESDFLKLSEGWLTSFKARNNLKEYKRHGEAASAPSETVEAERERVRKITSGYELKDIYNMDETGLFYGMPPDRGLAASQKSGVKGKKTRITYAFAANADGSDILQPFIIGKALKPRAFKKKTGEQLGFYYRNNAKAWMTMVLFAEWLLKWDAKLRREKRKILLLVDNFSGHKMDPAVKNIHLEFFAPNLTSHVQPMDAGIIRAFKAHYRSAFISRSIDRYDVGITPSDIYDINQLEAMRLADAAWSKVTPTTISNCFRKSGILAPSLPIPTSLSDDFLSEMAALEKQVSEDLCGLKSRGILQEANQMTIEELLHPDEENRSGVGGLTDEELFQALVDTEVEEIDEEFVCGDAQPPVQLPSRKEVLTAIASLSLFLQDQNQTYARQLEVLLGKLSRETRLDEAQTMQDSSILDYFQTL